MRRAAEGCTFSFSPENEGPKGGDDLKLVVAVSSHLSDGAGQDHTFRVHLLKQKKTHRGRQKTDKTTARNTQKAKAC